MTIEPHNARFRFGTAVKPSWPIQKPQPKPLDYAEVCRQERAAFARNQIGGGSGRYREIPVYRKAQILKLLIDGPLTAIHVRDTLGLVSTTMTGFRNALADDGLITVHHGGPGGFVLTITDQGRAWLADRESAPPEGQVAISRTTEAAQ
jgi:hypothetical protein